MLTNPINRIATLLSLALLLLALASITAPSQTNIPTTTAAPPSSRESSRGQPNAERLKQRWILSTLIVVLLGVGAIYLARKPRNAVGK
jgi:hypothetical protein